MRTIPQNPTDHTFPVPASPADTQLEAATRGDVDTAYRLMQAIIDRSPAAISVKDLDGRYLFVNDRRAAVSGRPPNEIIGKTDYDLGPAELAEWAKHTDD